MKTWQRRHHEASTAMDDREQRLDELYEEIEKDMIVSPLYFIITRDATLATLCFDDS